MNGWIEGYKDGYVATSPVGSFPANAHGLYDIAGNVFQWCEDWVDGECKLRTLRSGGSWVDYNRGSWMRLSRRAGQSPKARGVHYGFRCVLAAATTPGAAGVFPEPPAPLTPAPDGQWQDLISPLTPEYMVRAGLGWRLEGHELHSSELKYATLAMAGDLAHASYQVHVKLRALALKDVFHLVLPVGDRVCGFELDGYSGQYTGLQLVDGKAGKACPGVVEGRQVKDLEPHELEVTVKVDEANANISSTLDGHPLYHWSGPSTALSESSSWGYGVRGTLAIGAVTPDWMVSELKVKRLPAGK